MAAVADGLSPAGHTRAATGKPGEDSQLARSVLGRGVSRTKQESQTRVPSFRVKSTLRFESIAAPHFPQTSLGISLIGFNPFYRTTPASCFVLPSGGLVSWAKYGGIMRRRRRNGNCNRRSGTRGHGWRAVNISRWGRDDANERFPRCGNTGTGVWLPTGMAFGGRAVWLSYDESSISGIAMIRLRRSSIQNAEKRRSPVFRKSEEPRRLSKRTGRRKEIS